MTMDEETKTAPGSRNPSPRVVTIKRETRSAGSAGSTFRIQHSLAAAACQNEPDEEQAFLSQRLEQVLATMSGVDDNASIFVPG
jgi:hypothetical protein